MRKCLILALLIGGAWRLTVWRAKQDLSWAFCARLGTAEKSASFPSITGSLQPRFEGRWELAGASVVWQGQAFAFAGPVSLDASLAGIYPVFGHRVEISGPFRCLPPLRNPGRVEDGLMAFQPPRLSAGGKGFVIRPVADVADATARFSVAFQEWLGRPFRRFPGVLAFVRAVWIGDGNGLPESLVAYYREGGLLQIIALSGQHVTVMVMVLGVCLRGVARALLRFGYWNALSPAFRELRRLLPPSCALFLYVASQGAPSMLRTLAMSLALYVLRLRRFACSPLQLTGSAVACALLAEPELVRSPGFFLSAAATALLIQIAAEADPRHQVREYVVLATTMSLLTFPLSAFFFGKIAWSAPLNNLLLGWIWSFFLMPLGFACPFAARLLPERWGIAALTGLERAWETFVSAHEWAAGWVTAAYRTTVRPTWGEIALAEGLLILLCVAGARAWRRRGLSHLLFER